MNYIEIKKRILYVNNNRIDVIVCLFSSFRHKKTKILNLVSHSPVTNLPRQRQKPSGYNPIRSSNCDASIKSRRRTDPIRNNTNSGGGDSGYSEESFATTTNSSYIRPFHTSCPHCHCEQHSSFNNYKKSIENSSTDSSSSDTPINKEKYSSDFYYQLFQQKQALSSSRSYPHIKPLPKSTATTPTKPSIQQQQQRRSRALAVKRRRHLSCDSSLWAKTQRPNIIVRFK
jgi:hypothetical protein